MSLESPTKIERLFESLKGFGHWRYVVMGLAGLALLAAVLFMFDKCGDWSANRQINKHKANINAGLANIEKAEQTIANLQTDLAVEKFAVNAEVQNLANAANTSEAQRIETNRLLANVEAAKNVNTANASAGDLHRALEGLE